MKRACCLLLFLLPCLFAAACTPSAFPPPTANALDAKHPSAETLLWSLPSQAETLVMVDTPFEVPALESAPSPTLQNVFIALSLGLLRNIEDGRFHAGWRNAELIRALTATWPKQDTLRPGPVQDTLSILVFKLAISPRQWQILGGAAQSKHGEGEQQRFLFEQTVRGQTWKLWMGRSGAHVILLASDEQILLDTLTRQKNPTNPRALSPGHDIWKHAPIGSPVWAVHIQDDGPAVLAMDTPKEVIVHYADGAAEMGCEQGTYSAATVPDPNATRKERRLQFAEGTPKETVLCLLYELGYRLPKRPAAP